MKISLGMKESSRYHSRYWWKVGSNRGGVVLGRHQFSLKTDANFSGRDPGGSEALIISVKLRLVKRPYAQLKVRRRVNLVVRFFGTLSLNAENDCSCERQLL